MMYILEIVYRDIHGELYTDIVVSSDRSELVKIGNDESKSNNVYDTKISDMDKIKDNVWRY